MELFLLLLPAVILPVGLTIAGIWWMLGNDEEADDDVYADESMDDPMDGGF